MRIGLLPLLSLLTLGCSGGDAGSDLGAGSDLAMPDLGLDRPLCQSRYGGQTTLPGLKTGSVRLDLVMGRTSAFANFNVNELDGGTGADCTSTSIGACRIDVCSHLDNPQTIVAESAGVVQVTGGKMPLMLTPRADGTYPQLSSAAALWSGGETLSYGAPGAGAPGFSAQLSAPTAVTLTQPAIPGSGPLVIPRSQDLRVAWTATAPGVVDIGFASADAAARTDQIVTCEFSAETGQGVVPAAVLQQLTQQVVMYPSSLCAQRVTASDFQLLLFAEISQTGGVGVTLQ